MPRWLYPLWKNIRVTDEQEQPQKICVEVEGAGMTDKEIVFGQKTRLTFRIPPTKVSGKNIFLGCSVVPFGLRFSTSKNEWYQGVSLPCEDVELNFSFIAPTKEEWKDTVTPGFAIAFDVDGQIVFEQFLQVRFVSELS